LRVLGRRRIQIKQSINSECSMGKAERSFLKSVYK
jgi:hypothetical protein